MPNSAHRKKSLRKNREQRLENRAAKSQLSTQTKKVLAAVEAKNADVARAELKAALRLLDRARTAGLYHANTIARKKSQLTVSVNKLAAK